MVLPCWNRVSVYADPMRVLSYHHETHFLLGVRTISFSFTGSNPTPREKNSNVCSASFSVSVLRLVARRNSRLTLAWPRRHTVQCTGSGPDLALFFQSRYHNRGNSQCHCHTNTVPWTWEGETGSGPSPGTGVCHCSVAILKLQACAKLCTLCLYLFGVFYNSGITQTLILERSAIMPF